MKEQTTPMLVNMINSGVLGDNKTVKEVPEITKKEFNPKEYLYDRGSILLLIFIFNSLPC
jgi:hypothetical protein